MTYENARKAYPDIKGCIIHSDRGSQYTSAEYREKLQKYGIIQSMNSAGGRRHDNARCESMCARMKEELFYSRGDKSENQCFIFRIGLSVDINIFTKHGWYRKHVI